MSGNISKREAMRPASWFPAGSLGGIRDEMDDLITGLFGGRGLPFTQKGFVPSLDIAETDTAVEVTTDLPGYKPEEIHVEVHSGCLTISGETSSETKSEEKEGRKYHRVERHTGSFSRTVRLPCPVEEDQVDAELRDGVLAVTLPKPEGNRGRKVKVKGPGSDA